VLVNAEARNVTVLDASYAGTYELFGGGKTIYAGPKESDTRARSARCHFEDHSDKCDAG
jgi:hypothetical protein